MCIFDKTQKINRCKTASQFTQQLWDIEKKYLAHDTIQRLNCDMVYFNVKTKETLFGIIDLHICGSLK